MSEFVFDAAFSPWEMALSKMKRGSVLSAARFLALLERDQTVEAESAAMELEEREILLDISDLPRLASGGKTGARLQLEEKCYREGSLLQNLDENDPLRLTLEQIQQIGSLADADALAQKAVQGNEKAMEWLTGGNLPLVYTIAGEYIGHGVLLVDLIQEGSLGLWQAVMNYRGGSFEEHCSRWIRQAMARAVALQAHANGVGSHMAKAMEAYRKADRALLTQLGRNPGEEEIALEMGVSPEEAALIGKMIRQAQSMDRVWQANAPREPEPEDEQAVEDTAYFQSRQRINEMLSGLSELDTNILTMRFGLDGKAPMSAAHVGEKLGLRAQEVTNREAAALACLRK